MNRRSFMKGVLGAVAFVATPAFPFLWPLQDIPIPKTVDELYAVMNQMFTPASIVSKQAYEVIGGAVYTHLTYDLGKIVTDNHTEEVLVRSMFLTVDSMRRKAIGKPVILWRRIPKYIEEVDGYGFATLSPEPAPSVLKGVVRMRFSLMCSSLIICS